ACTDAEEGGELLLGPQGRALAWLGRMTRRIRSRGRGEATEQIHELLVDDARRGSLGTGGSDRRRRSDGLRWRRRLRGHVRLGARRQRKEGPRQHEDMLAGFANVA